MTAAICVFATSIAALPEAAGAKVQAHQTAVRHRTHARLEACPRPRRERAKRHGHRALPRETRCGAHRKTLSARTAGHAPATVADPATLWDGSFASGTIDPALYPHASFVSNHVAVVPDPLGSGQNVTKFAIPNSDAPGGSAEPRADLESPHLFTPTTNNNVYVSVPVLIPSDFPAANAGWLQVAELYGQPYGGSPTIGLGMWYTGGANHLELTRDQSHHYDVPWTGPALDGGWHTVTFHVQWSTDPSVGYVEIWYDGVPQPITGGADGTAGAGTRLYYDTLVSGTNWDGTNGNFLNIDCYRQSGAYPGTVTMYHGAPKIGTTLASVTPDAGFTGP